MRSADILKRGTDLVFALVAAVLLAPVLAAVACCVYFTIGSPVLFRQRRPGKGGAPFVLWKFRTMRAASGEQGAPQHDGDRLTRLGKFLRATSLDELPSLWNVLRGEMSLVGPRPLRMEYLPLYTPRQSRRHEVLPGVTGWAQIHGRQNLPFSKRLEYDVWYVENRTWRLDLWILLATIGKVAMRDGVRHGPVDSLEDDLGFSRYVRDSGEVTHDAKHQVDDSPHQESPTTRTGTSRRAA